MPVRPLTTELAQMARDELNETPKVLEEGIQHIKDWAAKQPHLRARLDDQWIAAFLRGCKHSLEKAKQKLDNYYSVRSITPEITALKYSDPFFMEVVKLGVTLVLPHTGKPTDPRIVLSRPGRADPNKYSPVDLMRVAFIMHQIMFMEDDTWVVAGGVNLMDLEGTTLSHFVNMTPSVMKKLVFAGEHASPIRIKGGHYINTPAAFETVYNLGKSLISEKNRSRFHIHGKDMESLYKFIPKHVLPVEYGGSGGTIDEITDYWVKKIQQYGPWFEEDLQFGTDESKRPGKPRSVEEMFGVEGSFRKLELD